MLKVCKFVLDKKIFVVNFKSKKRGSMEETKIEKEVKVKQKKVQPEEVVGEKLIQKYNTNASKKNTLYYIAMFVMNIAVLVLAMFYINYKKGVDSLGAFGEMFDGGIFVLMLSVFVLVKMIESVTLFVRLNQKTKYKNFGEVYKANAVGDYFGKMSTIGGGKTMATVGYLSDKKIKQTALVQVAYERRYYSLVAMLALSVIMLIVGAFAWDGVVHISITLICFGVVLCGCMYLLYIYMSRNDKQRSVNICSWASRAMEKLKLTKDVEKTYFDLVDKTMVVTKSRKVKPLYKVIDIVSSVATILLRSFVVYLIFEMVGLGGAESYFKSLLILISLDIIKYILPIPNGAIIIDIILLSIMGNVVLPEYVWMGLALYRIFDNLIIDFHYLIVVIINAISRCFVKEKVNKKN